jgi:hypothetical protein
MSRIQLLGACACKQAMGKVGDDWAEKSGERVEEFRCRERMRSHSAKSKNAPRSLSEVEYNRLVRESNPMNHSLHVLVCLSNVINHRCQALKIIVCNAIFNAGMEFFSGLLGW